MSKPEHDRTIDYIEFGATDIEATKRFYAACFGWKFTDYGPEYVAFEDGRLTGGFTTESKPGGAPLVVMYARSWKTSSPPSKRSVAASCARSSASPVDDAFTFSIRTVTSWQY